MVARLERRDDLGLVSAHAQLLQQAIASPGPSSPSRNAATACGGCAPTNSATTCPFRNAFTAGMLLTW